MPRPRERRIRPGTEQPAKWMQWSGLEPNGLGDFETDAKIIVAWVNANSGEARYENDLVGGARTDSRHRQNRIAVRTVDGWAYAKPGQYVVMGDETFYVKRTALSDYAVRSFSITEVQPDA